ncbi:hypothetical protein EDB89DRAFT_2017991 [Lactarius sanguifluus]|nr:hypothetical protein EDB89DRAFT_2017991 [Lactarius sanguifluus]
MTLDWSWEICVSPFLWFLVVLEATMISSLVLLPRSTCNVLTVLLQGEMAWVRKGLWVYWSDICNRRFPSPDFSRFAGPDLWKDSMFRDKQNRKASLRFLPCLSDTCRCCQPETCPLLCHCGDQLGEQGRLL